MSSCDTFFEGFSTFILCKFSLRIFARRQLKMGFFFYIGMKTIKIISKSLLPGLTIHSYFGVYKYVGYIIINCSNTGLL